ncbi:helix-turn-helix domain-containing protein [Phreatobacter stygius]|uniref:Helix-turn-helix domain-containing protein n=1 Tax=Phreatobacter stygius TaxID=1940610 RepID=A0A4D7BBD5_9HYPH|nr:helix-turn-helix domain-containing protein [Phreatobacter stygius]QCI67990.1 helix-turn-helix domain-containing protein [Phreatobacter stygius]
MTEELFTVERAAERLRLHPKTVLRFIRDGRLRATRVGKAYRILRSDLDALVGAAMPRGDDRPRPRATSIVDVPGVAVDEAARIATALQAMLMSQTARPEPIHLDTAYDPARRHLKVVIIAAPEDAAVLLDFLQRLAGPTT